MAKEVKNRRENLFINENPPEVLGISDIETKISTDGFVKNTDYASTTATGVIKVQTSAGSAVSGGGALISVERTSEQYDASARNMFISKGTLENVILGVFAKLLRDSIPDAHWEALATNTKVMFALNKEADGTYNLDIATQTPTS